MNHDGTDPWTSDELSLVKSGMHINAIKAYRERTGCSLFEGKKSWEIAKKGLNPNDTKACPHCNGSGVVSR